MENINSASSDCVEVLDMTLDRIHAAFGVSSAYGVIMVKTGIKTERVL